MVRDLSHLVTLFCVLHGEWVWIVVMHVGLSILISVLATEWKSEERDHAEGLQRKGGSRYVLAQVLTQGR